MKLNILLLLALAILGPLPAKAADETKPAPQRVIFDTDMLTDCDDAGALAMLHALQDRGEIELLGVVVNGVDTTGKHSAVVSAINTYFGRGKLPIGVTQRSEETSPKKPSSYAPAVYKEFSHDGKLDADRPAAVEVYQKLLSAAPDHSVTIISVGFLTNLEDLLRAEGGPSLISAKVKELAVMGGAYPSGKEYNFQFQNAGKATAYVLEHWPNDVPIVFSGFEVGKVINTGRGYQNAPNSPMRRAYEIAYDSLNKGRPSWDQTAVLYAARGLKHDGKTYFEKVTDGHNVIHPDGKNQWVKTDQRSRKESYLKLATSPDELAAEIEALMLAKPNSK